MFEFGTLGGFFGLTSQKLMVTSDTLDPLPCDVILHEWLGCFCCYHLSRNAGPSVDVLNNKIILWNNTPSKVSFSNRVDLSENTFSVCPVGPVFVTLQKRPQEALGAHLPICLLGPSVLRR